MATSELRVELGDRGYPVIVGEGLLDSLDRVLEKGRFRRCALITDQNVEALYAERTGASLEKAGISLGAVTVPRGEASKSFESLASVIDDMADGGLTRNDLVVALGGGVVGDLAGFAASVFKRGLSVLQCPTTLMAQVDSAIGGKTAVNIRQGKNLVGTFHQPVAVVSDTGTLSTLPRREFVSGLAEVAKYMFIRPEVWPEDARDLAPRLLAREQAALESVVARSARIKAEVVAEDETDRGLRAVLNYGHTLGHALETVSGYGEKYTHGQAVSVGMVFAARVAEAMGRAEPGLAGRHTRALASLELPARPVGDLPAFADLLEIMLQDKKSAGDLTMVLLKREGEPEVVSGIDAAFLERVYATSFSAIGDEQGANGGGDE